MLRTTLIKIKRICMLTLVPRTLRGDSKYSPTDFQKLSFAVTQKVQKSTNSGSKDKDEECKKCKKIIDYVFSDTLEVDKGFKHTCVQEIQDVHQDRMMMAPQVPLKDQKGVENEVIRKRTLDSKMPIEEIALATTAKENEEKLTQKIEHIDEPPLVEAEKPNIEGFNTQSKILGEKMTTNNFWEDNYRKKYPWMYSSSYYDYSNDGTQKCLDSNSNNKNEECKICQKIIDYVFGDTSEVDRKGFDQTCVQEIQDMHQDRITHIVTSQITSKDEYKTGNEVAEKKEIVPKRPIQEIVLTATAKENDDKSIHEIEHLNESPLMKNEKHKIEGYDTQSEIFNEKRRMQDLWEEYYKKKYPWIYNSLKCNYSKGESDENRKRSGFSPEADVQTTFDALAKQCFGTPSSKIDDRLLKEMKKLGVPQAGQKESDIEVIDLPKNPRKPVKKTEIDLETREIEKDPIDCDHMNPSVHSLQSPYKPSYVTNEEIMHGSEIALISEPMRPAHREPKIPINSTINNKFQASINTPSSKTSVTIKMDPDRVLIDPYDKGTIAQETDVDYNDTYMQQYTTRMASYFERHADENKEIKAESNAEIINKSNVSTTKYTVSGNNPITQTDQTSETSPTVNQQQHYFEAQTNWNDSSYPMQNTYAETNTGNAPESNVSTTEDNIPENDPNIQTHQTSETSPIAVNYPRNVNEEQPYLSYASNPQQNAYVVESNMSEERNQSQNFFVAEPSLREAPSQQQNTSETETRSESEEVRKNPQSEFEAKPNLSKVLYHSKSAIESNSILNEAPARTQKLIGEKSDMHEEHRQAQNVLEVNPNMDKTPNQKQSVFETYSNPNQLPNQSENVNQIKSNLKKVSDGSRGVIEEKSDNELQNIYMAETKPNKELNIPRLKHRRSSTQFSHSLIQPEPLVDPSLFDRKPLTHPAKTIDYETMPATEPLQKPDESNVPLSELLKRIRKRNRMQQFYKLQMQNVVEPEVCGKCGKKPPPCPPPAPTCPPPPPPPSPPCPPPPPKCPKPCKPKCPEPCPKPDPCKPKPPPTCSCDPCISPKSKCNKFKKSYSLNDILMLLLRLGPQPNMPKKLAAFPLIGLNLENGKYGEQLQKRCDNECEALHAEHVIMGLRSLGRSLASDVSNVKSECSQTVNYEINDDSVVYVRDFDPWTPIPSWPVPKKEKKRPLICPKEGCKIIPPPKLTDPCPRSNPCLGLPKKNFSIRDLHEKQNHIPFLDIEQF